MAQQFCVENIDDYNMKRVKGKKGLDDMLFTRKKYITEDEVHKLNFINSNILSCEIKNGDSVISQERKYLSNLINLWIPMSFEKILTNTTFNIKLIEESENGYHFRSELGFSIQNKDANGTFKELINMVKVNNFTMSICISLKKGEDYETVYFKI